MMDIVGSRNGLPTMGSGVSDVDDEELRGTFGSLGLKSTTRVDSVEFSSPLQKDVALLRSTFTQVLEASCDLKTLDAIDQINRASKLYDLSNEEKAFEKLASIIEKLEDKELATIAGVFSMICNLANIAENVHRIRRRRAYERGEGALGYLHSCTEAFTELEQQGYTARDISAALSKQTVRGFCADQIPVREPCTNNEAESISLLASPLLTCR